MTLAARFIETQTAPKNLAERPDNLTMLEIYALPTKPVSGLRMRNFAT